MTGSATNITDAQRSAFEALASGAFANFALFSCFVNGEPASAIVAVTEDGEDITITPLFVSVTPGMILVDHDGTTAGALGRFQVQQHTLCDGWINTWSVIEADGTQTPQTFASYAEAKAELAEFLDDIAADIETGDRGENSGFEREEFRIVPVI